MITPDQSITRSLEQWFESSARDLPWRLDTRDPYHALVSEFMLQQTQVSRVIEKYEPFIARFPTVESLASAHEDEVLALWAGLGYYRRARMLHACAKSIVDLHGGQVPQSIEDLESLPGVGRYTAGAIASMVFNQRAAIVDGNVTRVLMRLHNRETPQTDKDTVVWAWQRAQELVDASSKPGAFNESMMELGATICTPKNIRCDQCPVQRSCQAFAMGTTESVPLPKPRAKQKSMYCAVAIVEHDGAILLEQRPAIGMWSNMFQTPTLERDDRLPTLDELAKDLEIESGQLTAAGQFTHITTHRIIEFVVYRVDSKGIPKARKSSNRRYQPLQTLDQVAISNAQRKVLTIAGIL